MLKCKKQPYNSIWISADSQDELAITFMRFQEFYESPNPEFKNKIFTVGQLKSWYSTHYGADTYHKDWIGFNFPSKVLIPFKQGLFDPLTELESELLNLLRYRHDNFYIIGAQDQAVLRHELSHALYGYSIKYRTAINSYITRHKNKFKAITKYILDKGYSKEVINDEIQAYVTDSDDIFIKSNLDISLINGIHQIYNKYNTYKSI